MVKKVKTNTQGIQRHRSNGILYSEKSNSTQFKLRKISGSAVSKWKPVPSHVQELVISWLEDSILNISGEQTQAENRTIMSIRTNVVRRLKSLKVPVGKWLDVESLKTAKKELKSAKKQFDETEAKLTSAIEMETRELEQLQDAVDEMKELTNHQDHQLHPILRVLSV